MVSQQRLKRPVSALVAIVFLTSLLITMLFEVYSTVSANTPIKPVILELTDLAESNKDTTSAAYTIPSQLNLGNAYIVKTMTVKQFNASREDLLGKYDAVVFGPSRVTNLTGAKKYSPEKAVYDFSLQKTLKWNASKNRFEDDITPITNYTKKAHNTSLLENDITELKQRELKKLMDYGVPVFFHKDVFTTDNENATGLKRNFDFFKFEQNNVFSNISQGKEKVVQVFSNKKINRVMSVDVIQDNRTLSNNVNANTINTNNIASAGKPILFEYQLATAPSANAIIELYIDFDSNDRFTDQEFIERKTAYSKGEFSYTIDVPSYTSPRYWKIIVRDDVNNSVSYQTGRFLLKDEKANVNVLQVVSGTNNDSKTGKTTKIGSLEDAFAGSDLLSNNDLFDFKVEVIDFAEFDAKICGNNESTYSEWLFKYDLIIFGFKDTYVSGLNISCSEPALTKFMDEGRGVMFTHDMLYRIEKDNKFSNDSANQTSWEKYYANRFAVNQFTNMGIYAQKTTNQVQQVSKGLFTEYPYKLAEKPATSNQKMIETTHNQYFALDLENPSVTPWYNLVGERTIGDSAHHYYMYTVDNLTYSGAGHTNTFTTQIEKEIFVNTMFRAFIGSNHAPKIEVINPQLEQNRQASVYDIEPLYLSWKSLDYDFADRFLDTRVLINEKQVYPAENGKFASVRNGETSGFFYEHNAQAGSQLNVRIETKEQRTKGAITSTESFVVNVLESEEAAFVSRTISPLTTEVENQIALTYNLNYSVPFIQKPNGNAYKEFAWTVNVEETIPSGYTVLDSSLPTGWKRVGDKLVGSISDECVIEKNDSSCKVNDTKIEVKLVANKVGNYTFDQGTFDYVFEANHNSNGTDKHDVEKEGAGKLTSVNTTVLEKEIERLQLEGPIYLNIGETRQVTPILTPETARKLDLKWVIGSSAAELTPSYVNNSASIKGMKPGKTTVRVEYTSPVTGKTIQSNKIEIIVDDPPTQFSANNLNLLVGEEGIIRPSIKTTNDEYRNFRFDIVSGQNAVKVVQQTKQELKLSGNAPGTVQVKVSLVNQPANQPVAPIFVNVQVSLPGLSVSPTEATLWVYRDSEGTLVQQSTNLSLIQTGSVRLPVSWELPSGTSEITLGTPRADGVTVQAVQGTGTTQRLIPVTGAFTNFASQRVTAMIDVKEYPQDMLASNIELYMENSPYTYEPVFLPSTANVRGFGMQVAEGSDVVEIVDQTKLRLKKPGLAKVRIATEDVSRFFSGTNGPKIIYREFYVRVREGADPNPGSPEDAGDYY
ncbi:DUF5057 domain-containing protein [Exiguobacterium sp. SH0S2]|uniref:DUF5057 domain-containing protein n=1 Tax=Exiguobacterium sp. SH0S2 TaxID=2510950 RepID=UPI001375DAD6|nr:DUF5057 domain-containing protein [Exiguobacterium sp. SH0S2]